MATQDSLRCGGVFECVKLFEVEESSPTAGGEKPINSFDSSSSIGIDLCCWKECTDHTLLVLVCNNGYIVTRVALGENRPVVKQLKWFESRQRHILGIALDPLGEWLVCACLDGALYVVPILGLMLNCALRNKFGSVSDITTITPRKKIASPTSVVWWETMDGKHFCITGSEVGEVTFFNLKTGEDVATVYVSGCVDTLMIAHHPDTSTHLLVGLRGGEWRRMLLEEHFHEVAGTSYTDATASGFEVLPDDIVIKSFPSHMRGEGPADGSFELKPFPQIFSELNHLSTQEWQNQRCLTALNLRTHKMEVYSYDFDLMQEPLKTYQLVPRAMGALLTERVIFVISHEDEANPCAFTLAVMSRQRSTVTVAEMDDQATLHSNALLQQFTIPSHSNLVGFYATTKRSHDLDSWSGDPDAPPTSNLGGCLIVTTTGVYQCRQVLSPEAIFLDMALSQKTHEKAEDFGITFKLDVCGLYKVAAERKLTEKQFGQALRLFELSRCPSSYIIECFSQAERVPELVSYLHRLVYDDLGHASLSNPKQVQNVLLKCFIHECLRCHGQPEGAVMMDKFGQFINDKFLYNQAAAIDMLIQGGLKEQLFELAKSHRKLAEVLELLVKCGSMEVDPSVQSSLASRQYAEVLSQAANGLFLYQMTPSTFVRLLIAKPSIISSHLDHLLSLLPRLDIATLLRLAHLFDPSHDTIRPLLIRAHSHRKRSNSTGSLLSMVSSGGGGVGGDSTQGEEPGPRLDAYLETFLTILVILNHRRRQKLSTNHALLSLSPLRSAVSGSADTASVKSYTEGSQWVRGRTIGCGLHHAALVVHGNLYTWGSTKNGKLGHGDIEEAGKAAPLRVETLSMLGVHVVSVSCGAEHTIALCQEGVFSWGSSSHGQLGHGDTVKKTRPVQLAALADKSVVSVVCGQYHSLALDDDHRVWTWGWGVHGQLGLKSVDDRLVPTHASLLDDWQVSFVAAGYGHSAVLTSEGKVLTFGNGMYGQLGHGNTEKQTAPKLVEALQDKTAYILACGNFHNIVVTTEQCIYYWGKNLHRAHHGSSVQGLKEYKRSRERQQSSASTNTLTPQQLSDAAGLDGTAVQVSCGSYHALLLTSEGSVYSWGSNNHGQLGQAHTAEKSQPARVGSFEEHKVVAIATGDEFSLVVDDRGTPWTWGRADQGQLGVSQEGTRPRQSQSLFKPKPITSIPSATDQSSKSDKTSPDPNELPVLELDLGWELPDFASVGAHHTPYGRKALELALDKLYGFYRTSKVLWQCTDWRDWESVTRIMDLERQWSQALMFALRALMEQPGLSLARSKAGTVTDSYLQKFISEAKDQFSANFIWEGHNLLFNLVTSWERHHLDFSLLEGILYKHLPVLSYPLSLLLRGKFSQNFSFDFHLSVSKEVTSLISSGYQPPDDIIQSPTAVVSDPASSEQQKQQTKKLTLETSAGDGRLWLEILRNLSKDLSKHNFIHLSESAIAGIERERSRVADSGLTGEEGERERHRPPSEMVSFSCGHAFSLARFQEKMLLEFVERVQDFPIPIPHTLKHLQLYYRQSRFYPSACLGCVFQYLRKVQLQECPGVPIRPWNP